MLHDKCNIHMILLFFPNPSSVSLFCNLITFFHVFFIEITGYWWKILSHGWKNHHFAININHCFKRKSIPKKEQREPKTLFFIWSHYQLMIFLMSHIWNLIELFTPWIKSLFYKWLIKSAGHRGKMKLFYCRIINETTI